MKRQIDWFINFTSLYRIWHKLVEYWDFEKKNRICKSNDFQ